jgi:hypothetical protein
MGVSLSADDAKVHAGHRYKIAASHSIFREKQFVEKDLCVHFRGQVSMTGQKEWDQKV